MPSCCRIGPGLKWTYTFVSSGTPTLGPQNEGFPIAHYGGASPHQWRLVHLEPKLNVRNYAAFVSELYFARAVVYLYKKNGCFCDFTHLTFLFPDLASPAIHWVRGIDVRELWIEWEQPPKTQGGELLYSYSAIIDQGINECFLRGLKYQ